MGGAVTAFTGCDIELVEVCSGCNRPVHIHAKGRCKRCYMHAFNTTPAAGERRRRYVAKHPQRVIAAYRKYNEKRRPTPGSLDQLVRVAVKGWGVRV